MRHGFLIDIDGAIYRGSQLIPGTDRYISSRLKQDIPFLFLTNNSQRSRRDVGTKLERMGITLGEPHIFGCAMATARFLKQQKPHGTAYVVGEGGLPHTLHRNGYSIVDHDPDYVVIGERRALNFEMIETAVRMVEAGAKLIATTAAPTIPRGGEVEHRA